MICGHCCIGVIALAAIATINPASAGDDDAVRSGHLKGIVRDEGGKPLAGATVLAQRLSDAKLASGPFPEARTGPDGSYDLEVRYLGDRPITIRDIWVESKGYVRSEHSRGIPLKDGESVPLDFTLAKGEILAGVIRLPASPLSRRMGENPNEREFIFQVAGPSFEQHFLAKKGGKFEVYLPPGEYTLRCLTGAGANTPAWKGLRTGRTDLVLEPIPFRFTEEALGAQFDRVWDAMDRNYSYFSLKPDVDWVALKGRYRPRALKAKDVAEFTAVLREMLGHLEDMHVWIETPGGIAGTFKNPYRANFNRKATVAALEAPVDCGFAAVGKTKAGGFGYFLMVRQSSATPEGVDKAIAAIEALRDAPGFIVDLRQANGGDERKAAQIAGLFCARDTVYAKSKIRNGEAHDAFTPDRERILKATAHPFTKPVVCLIGPGAVSSGEGFAKMMMALPQVTTVGMPTRGASGNPHPVELPDLGIAVSFSRWVDMTPDGKSFEGVGLPPDLKLDLPPDAYGDRDPTLEKGLEILRERIAGEDRPEADETSKAPGGSDPCRE